MDSLGILSGLHAFVYKGLIKMCRISLLAGFGISWSEISFRQTSLVALLLLPRKQSYWIILPEIFSVGITCQLIDLLPAFPVIMLAAAFAWQSIVGFR